MRAWWTGVLRVAALLLPLSALVSSCVTPSLEQSPTVVQAEIRYFVPQDVRDKVDVLFMVDNSRSMSAMTAELRSRFPQLLKVFRDLAARETFADLHVAVVTSDFGAGSAVGAGSCGVSPGGDRGRMIQKGRAAGDDCQGPVGKSYIEYSFRRDAPHNLPPGQSLEQTFTCMASVGDGGCGFEHQLEAAYAALHDPIPENRGFLRDDALLAVVFLTNEDDCSAPPQTDLFDANPSTADRYGHLDSYRCTRFGIVCDRDEAPPYGASSRPLGPCRPAPNPIGAGPGRLYDVRRYIDFFTRPRSEGGVKTNPSDVLLAAIDAPEEPVRVLLSNPAALAGVPFVPCDRLDETSSPPCVPVLQHSCVNPGNPGFFGDPAIRINTVVRAVRLHRVSSICDADHTDILSDLRGLIFSSTSSVACFEARLPDDPDCVVEDVTTSPDGTRTVVGLPRCADGIKPCWRMEAACFGLSPQGLGIRIDRGESRPPPNTTSVISCRTCPSGGCSP